MSSFSWLHLSDLHWGHTNQALFWPTVERQLFEDLERLDRLAGRLDAVFFTGDLANRGLPGELDEVEVFLTRLWARLRELGSDPVLLAVPGNHDLARPHPDQAQAVATALHDDAAARAAFWSEPKGSLRAVVDGAFDGYRRWWQRHPLPRPRRLSEGVLPGDFAATIEIEGDRIGIVGLNSAFLQLAGGDFQGRLVVAVEQFQHACGGNGPDWTGEHDVCMLLTHHPTSWLADDGRFRSEVGRSEYFALHLFGHEHRAEGESVSRSGRPTIRSWQEGSLFSQVPRAETSAPRRHAYSVGRLELEDGEARLRRWPRTAVDWAPGPWRLVPDYVAFDLDADHGTRAETFAIQRSGARRGTVRPASAGALRSLARAPRCARRPGFRCGSAPLRLHAQRFLPPSGSGAQAEVVGRCLVAARFDRCTLHLVRFVEGHLSGANLFDSTLSRVLFRSCRMVRLVAYSSKLHGCSFEDCDLTEALFIRCVFTRGNFHLHLAEGARGDGMVLDRCEFEGWSEAEIAGALAGAELRSCTFR